MMIFNEMWFGRGTGGAKNGAWSQVYVGCFSAIVRMKTMIMRMMTMMTMMMMTTLQDYHNQAIRASPS